MQVEDATRADYLLPTKPFFELELLTSDSDSKSFADFLCRFLRRHCGGKSAETCVTHPR